MPKQPPCSVIELRQYLLHPGRRDELIGLFEREFIDTQQAVGLHVLGIFRDADADDRFVWLRGFADMESRARGLAAFYGGPVWQRHRDAANATMIDSDDVLLLRPLTAPPAVTARPGPWQAMVWRSAAPAGAPLRGELHASGLAWFETEASPNNFPRLPVREGEQVLVALAPGLVLLPGALQRRLGPPLQTLNLLPTLASPLR